MKNLTLNNNKCFALVTGASSGIGYAIAEQLALRKYNLVLVALPGTGLEEKGGSLAQRYGIEVSTFATDLTHPRALTEVIRACEDINLTVLVNNAGFGNLELFENSDLDELRQMMTLNNQTLVALTHLCIPLLRRAGASYILNLGSLASVFRIPYKAVYSATKSFVYSFSAALRLELAASGISVSCLCPGSTLTSLRVRKILERTSGKNSLFTQTPEAVAITAVEEMFRKRFRIVPGFHNKLLLCFARVLPEAVTNQILMRMFQPRENPPMPMLPARHLA